MKKVFKYIGSYKKEIVLSPLFKLFEACFELTVPLIIAAVIDRGINLGGEPDLPFIYKMSLVMVALGVVGVVCAITAQFYAAKAAVGFSEKIKAVLFRKIQSLSYTEFDKLGNSTMITRMTSDVNQIQNAVNLVLRLFLRAPIIVFGAMIMAFYVDSVAAVNFVVIIPLLMLVVFGIMYITVPLFKKVQSKVDNLLGVTRENLTGTRVVRAFAQEDNEIRRFSTINEELTGLQKFVGKFSVLTSPLTFLLINCAIIALIWTGAIRVNYGHLSQGQVIALYNYMTQILVELIKMANFIVAVTKGIASTNRIESMLDMQPSVKTPQNGGISNREIEGLVEFENIALTYSGAGAPSLLSINISAKRGETIGILGGTGSGKTSVVNLIPRFYDATEGSVKIDGEDVKNYDVDMLRANIGIVPQKAQLFMGTVRDNLKMGNEDASDEELEDALKVAQGWDFIKNKKGGLDFFIDQSGKNLSGGQKQRLTIARALVRKPKILILDDSASALDYATDYSLRKAISALPYKPTTFIVSQRASSILSADRVLVLEDGECVGYDTPENLLKTCEVYREIYNCQFSNGESDAR